MDVQIEQQKLSNLLLQNIAELLRVPESEKERQHCIEMGVKFFVNASKNADLYEDALEELLKAESLMKQDYFVLHRIGCIYLYAEKHINPAKALDYFLRAAKYASVESDINATRLINILTNNFNTVNNQIENSDSQIGFLAADSYEKAAFTSYILGYFEDSVKYQSKALYLNNSPQNRFILAKYQVRHGLIDDAIQNLDSCINIEPKFALGVFKEIDLVNEPKVIELVNLKNIEINKQINKLIETWKNAASTEANYVVEQLTKLPEKEYEIKVIEFHKYIEKEKKLKSTLNEHEEKINKIIDGIRNTTFSSFNTSKIDSIINDLEKANSMPLEKMEEVLKEKQAEITADKLKIGSKYEGGIVFYLDETGRHGLVCYTSDLDKAVWGTDYKFFELIFDVISNPGISNGVGTSWTKKIIEFASVEKKIIKNGFFSTKEVFTEISTAARICLESNLNGFNDWYLPTIDELKLMYENLHRKGIGNFNNEDYWSSTSGIDKAMALSFYDIDFDKKSSHLADYLRLRMGNRNEAFPNRISEKKYVLLNVRPVRAF
jgi:hypothetical protein